MNRQHNYSIEIKWTGNRGTGTSGYREYDRSHVLKSQGRIDIQCSSDSAFKGDKTKHNPEDMLVYSISSCHMLWYLHLCADAGIIVTDYKDEATGIMMEDPVNGGRFESVTLNPVVTITDESKIEKANTLHDAAHKKCFISNSVNFPVMHNVRCEVKEVK